MVKTKINSIDQKEISRKNIFIYFFLIFFMTGLGFCSILISPYTLYKQGVDIT
jgi:hypothetical protein